MREPGSASGWGAIWELSGQLTGHWGDSSVHWEYTTNSYSYVPAMLSPIASLRLRSTSDCGIRSVMKVTRVALILSSIFVGKFAGGAEATVLFWEKRS